MPELVDVGVAGILVVLILDRVFKFLENKRSDKSSGDAQCNAKGIEVLVKQVQDLWNWHNIVDRDGVRNWYVKQSMEVTIKELTAVMREHSGTMRELSSIIHSLKKLVETK